MFNSFFVYLISIFYVFAETASSVKSRIDPSNRNQLAIARYASDNANLYFQQHFFTMAEGHENWHGRGMMLSFRETLSILFGVDLRLLILNLTFTTYSCTLTVKIRCTQNRQAVITIQRSIAMRERGRNCNTIALSLVSFAF